MIIEHPAGGEVHINPRQVTMWTKTKANVAGKTIEVTAIQMSDGKDLHDKRTPENFGKAWENAMRRLNMPAT